MIEYVKPNEMLEEKVASPGPYRPKLNDMVKNSSETVRATILALPKVTMRTVKVAVKCSEKHAQRLINRLIANNQLMTREARYNLQFPPPVIEEEIIEIPEASGDPE